MSVYLDASFLIPLFVVDAHTQRARAYLKGLPDDLIVSNFAAAEFASGVARLVRMSELDADRVPEVFDSFDRWTGQQTERVELRSSDIKEAEHLLRSLAFRLATPDVLHITIARRLGAGIATFDIKMARHAVQLGSVVAQI
jgi:predicted nucleic acid-binding protein